MKQYLQYVLLSVGLVSCLGLWQSVVETAYVPLQRTHTALASKNDSGSYFCMRVCVCVCVRVSPLAIIAVVSLSSLSVIVAAYVGC